MDLLRHLTLLTLKYNKYIRAKHIPGNAMRVPTLFLDFSFNGSVYWHPRQMSLHTKCQAFCWTSKRHPTLYWFVCCSLDKINLQCRRKTIYCLLQFILATASGTVLTTASKRRHSGHVLSLFSKKHKTYVKNNRHYEVDRAVWQIAWRNCRRFWRWREYHKRGYPKVSKYC